MVDPQESRFWKAALQSELIDSAGLQACWDAIPPEKRSGDAAQIDRRLARQAVHAGLLTLWQAQQLLAGRSTGFKINRYTLLELIGQGGMGRVYLAKDTRLNRRVALKILSPERVNNPRAIARFQREARVGAQLQHENLVRIYDEGEANGKCYLVMEFIEGKNIGTLIADNGPMPPGLAAKLVREVALGLEHAQQKGLIHRDVNPYNILVTNEGVAKLTDLGLAIDLAEQAPVTRDGATVGTFDYVSPEQARHSHAVDTRSDIYSLGCTLYHMLAARVPFPSPSLPEKLFGHQALDPESLAGFVPGIPEGLVDVVRKMMRKNPDERYQTPKDVAQALEPFIDAQDLGTSTSRDDGSSARHVSPLAETRVVAQVKPTPPPGPTVSATNAPVDAGLDLGGPRVEAAETGIDLGIALNLAGTAAPAPKPAAATPPPAPAPTKPAPPKAAPPPSPKPATGPELLPDFGAALGGGELAEETVDLGLDLNLAPSSPPAPAATKSAAPVAPAAPAVKAPTPPKPSAPAPPALPPDFALSLGGEAPPQEEGLNLGLNLDSGPSPAPAPVPKAGPKPAPPPPKPAAPVPDFAVNLSESTPDDLPLGLGLNLGPAGPLATAKPAPPNPVHASQSRPGNPQAAGHAAPEARMKQPRKLDRRVLIGAAAGSLLFLVVVGAVVAMGFLGGGSEKPAAAKGKSDESRKGPKTTGKTEREQSVNDSSESEIASTAAPGKGKEPDFFRKKPIAPGAGFAVRTGDSEVVIEPDLKNAFQKAMGSKGHVVLSNREPIKLKGDDAAITVGGRDLRIVAEKGTEPVLEVEIKDGKSSWLTIRAESSLTMEGVTVVARYVGKTGPNPPPVIYSGSNVTLDRCVFRTTGAVPGSCAVAVDAQSLMATGCFFENFDRALDFSAFSGRGVIVKQCMMVQPKATSAALGWALRMRYAPDPAASAKALPTRKVWLERCTVKGKGLLELADFSPAHPCAVQVNDCAVLADAVLAWEHAEPGKVPPSPPALQWRGLGNRYDIQGKSWIVLDHDGSKPLPDGPSDVGAWNQRMADSDATAGPLKFQTSVEAMRAEGNGPADFALPDQGDMKAGAEPDAVGPGGKSPK